MSQCGVYPTKVTLAENKVTQFTYPCGLAHSNIPTDTHTNRYCGAFFVRTPSVDDSGIAHAVEHLVFRQSRSFNDPSSFHQLVALTSISLNASTLNGVTCFHFSASNQVHFHLAAEYLLMGMLSPIIGREQHLKEVSNGEDLGVIYRELNGYQSNPHYLRQIEVLRGDQSQHRIACYGGVTDTLADITVDDLRDYHRRYYRSANIELITCCPDIQAFVVHLDTLLKSQNDQPQRFATHRKQLFSCTPNLSKQSKTVFSWWLDQSFYCYVKKLEPVLNEMIASLDAHLLPLSYECNSNSQFALRVLGQPNQLKQIHQQLIELIDTPHAYAQPWHFEDGKYPKAIQRLIRFYYQGHSNGEEMSLTRLTQQIRNRACTSTLANIRCSDVETITQSPREPLTKPLNEVIPQLLAERQLSTRSVPWRSVAIVSLRKEVNPRVVVRLIEKKWEWRALAYGSTLLMETTRDRDVLQVDIDALINQNPLCYFVDLPAILRPLEQKITLDSPQCWYQDNWLYRLPLQPQNRLIAELSHYIIQASGLFMRPRMDGECYVVACHYCHHTNQLYFYSVFDKYPAQRKQHVYHALTALAENGRFISHSLPLAKNKLLSHYPTQHGAFSPKQIDEITKNADAPFDLIFLDNFLQQVSETCIRHFLFQLADEIINN